MLKSVCGYCGVGCGLEFDKEKLIGDLTYPSNYGKLCAKGVSELMTIQTFSRLLKPKLRDSLDEHYKEIPWKSAIDTLANKISITPSDKIGFYLSGQLLTEDFYIINKLAKGFLGCGNVDSNSRTCMTSSVVAMENAFGEDFIPFNLEELSQTEVLILVGSNLAEAHVVLFNQVLKEQKRGMKLIVIDPRETETAKAANLHIPIKVNGDIDLFSLLAKDLIEKNLVDEEFVSSNVNGYDRFKNSLKRSPSGKMLKRCGISKDLYSELLALFTSSEKVVTAWTMGVNQSAQGVDKVQSIINLHLISGKILKEGAGVFSLTGQPNAMGGREVGGLATTLAVHLGYEEQNIQKVKEFWKAPKMAKKEGVVATEMLSADLDVLIIVHTDPIYHLPNRHKNEELMKKIPFVVEINAYDDSETSSFAHLKLPAAPWGEKEGTQTNLDRIITKQERLTRPSPICKADWEIFRDVAHTLGFKSSFNYEKAEDIFNEYKQMTKLSKNSLLDLHKTDYQSLKNGYFKWGEESFQKREFFTENKKANLSPVTNKLLSERKDLQFPFSLITGRTRDQWHSGTKTSFVDSLLTFKPRSFVEINPIDASGLNIKNGDRVIVQTKRGELESEAFVTETIPKGNLFIPVTDRKINYLTNDLLDKESKQPDFNGSSGNIIKVQQ